MELLYSIYDWVKETVYYFAQWTNKEANIVFLGLDNAGKTTLLHFLKFGKIKQSPPTRNPTMEELEIQGHTLRAYDLGGNVNERPLWDSYFPLVNGVVFIVDIADQDRIDEAKDVLQQIFAVESLADAPFLILANKIDLPTALSPAEVHHRLELGKVVYSRKVNVAMISIVRKHGIKEAFQWLGQELK